MDSDIVRHSHACIITNKSDINEISASGEQTDWIFSGTASHMSLKNVTMTHFNDVTTHASQYLHAAYERMSTLVHLKIEIIILHTTKNGFRSLKVEACVNAEI